MASISVFFVGDEHGTPNWDIIISEPQAKPFRKYRGLRLRRIGGQSLGNSINCAVIMHMANMIVTGRTMSPLSSVTFFDQLGRFITPPEGLKELPFDS